MIQATPISAEEAIRRIKERDHVIPTAGAMSQKMEDALIVAIREGKLLAGLTEDGQLAFMSQR